jgi:hypothetical protein
VKPVATLAEEGEAGIDEEIVTLSATPPAPRAG